jgi:hypothetical protein
MSLIVPASFFGNFAIYNDPIINSSQPYALSVSKNLVYSDGSSVIVGFFDTVDSIPFQNIAKLDRFGNVDTSKNRLAVSEEIYSVAKLNNNLFISGNFTTINGSNSPYTACLNDDFSLVSNKRPAVNDLTYYIDCDTVTSKILACGYFTTPKNRIARFMFDNSGNTIVDPTFTPPSLTIPSGNVGIYKSIFAYNSSDITVCGDFVSGTRRGIVKLNNNGTINTSFNANITSGRVYTFDYVNKTSVGASTSDIIIGGDITITSPYRNIVRITSTGSISSSWNSNIPTQYAVYSIFYESDSSRQNYGKILCVAGYDLFLLNGVTGIIDPTFNNNIGKITVQGTTGIIKSIDSLGDDTYALCGDFSNLDGDTSKRFYARINYDGTVL